MLTTILHWCQYEIEYCGGQIHSWWVGVRLWEYVGLLTAALAFGWVLLKSNAR